ENSVQPIPVEVTGGRKDAIFPTALSNAFVFDTSYRVVDTLENGRGFYRWDEAMQYSTTQGAQGIYPPGSHIPGFSESEALRSAVNSNSNNLKAIGQGEGYGI
ncbi:MAG TPA: hypothetical protein VI932_04630, partial [Bacteroidota bacterium]|nr:hypothetical protein [Bacteroidota bacterium]